MEREARQEVAAREYLRGASLRKIGEIVGTSHVTVLNDINTIRERWKSNAERDLGERISEELAKIDNLESEYWNAWNRSREERKRQRLRTSGMGDVRAGKSDVVEIDRTNETEELIGDPRYLAGVQWCIERRCKLLGIDAPTKADFSISGKNNAKIEIEVSKAEDKAILDAIKEVGSGIIAAYRDRDANAYGIGDADTTSTGGGVDPDTTD